MNTIKGEIDESLLTKEVIDQIVPCGKSVTTKYFLGDELVRQDVNIIVEQIEHVIGDVKLF